MFELSGSITFFRSKITNYIYLLTIQKCGIQYVGESTTQVSLRMNIYRKCKSGFEHSSVTIKMSVKVSVSPFKFWKS